MDHTQRRRLLILLLQVPDIEDYATRTDLLTGLSLRVGLQRSQTNAQTDISRLIDQLAPIHLQTGQWALSILIENARVRLGETVAGQELAQLHEELLLSNQPAKEESNRTARARPHQEFTPSNQPTKEESNCTAMQKIEIAVIAAPQDTKYSDQIVTALQFLEKVMPISVWHRGAVISGSVTKQVIEDHIQAAQIILVLMSPDFLARKFYSDKTNHIDTIIQRSKLDSVHVIPILIRPCLWYVSPFNDLTPLPADGNFLTSISNRSKALNDIVEAVRAIARTMVDGMSSVSSKGQPTQVIAQEDATLFPATFVHGYALLIGVGGDGLAVTIEDARKLEKVLTNSARAAYPSEQVKTLLGENATREKIIAAFQDLTARVARDPEATVIVYFSGHGGEFSQDDQAVEYCLIPHGYDLARRHETAITDHEFTVMIEAIQARKLVVLLDCCHAGAIPMLKGVESFKRSSQPPELFQVLGSGKGNAVIASSRGEEKSQTDAHGSVFTNCLLEVLRGKGALEGAVRIFNVLSYVFREVPLRTNDRQHPFVNKILNMDEDFVLCYSAVVMKGVSDSMDEPSHVSSQPSSLVAFQRERLEIERDELLRSLSHCDKKVERLRHALDLDGTDPLRGYQYEQQLFDELQKRTSIKEDLQVIIRQLSS